MTKLLLPALAIGLTATAGCAPTGGELSPQTYSQDSTAIAAPSAPAAYPLVGGATMDPTKTVVDNAANSKDHTTLVAAIRAAGLVDTLQGSGPFTVFAPTDAAFDKLPSGTVQTMLHPGYKNKLTDLLTYHVVRGRKTAAIIMADIRAGKGSVNYLTAAGHTITARMDGDAVVIIDAKGRSSRVTQSDVMQSNGVIHVVDTVLMPFGIGFA